MDSLDVKHRRHLPQAIRVLAVSLGLMLSFGWVFSAGPAGSASHQSAALTVHDPDPLRQYLPREDIFMPVPGGISAVSIEGDRSDSIEAQMHHQHGGLVVGYCLRASCTRVTHLAILQVCNSRIGGLEGANALILGVIRLPYGNHPGFLMSLQGRNYAENFALYGPYRQDISNWAQKEGTSLSTVWAEGLGPVAPLQFVGLDVKPQQGRDTISLQVAYARFPQTSLKLPRLEVRHYCKRPIS